MTYGRFKKIDRKKLKWIILVPVLICATFFYAACGSSSGEVSIGEDEMMLTSPDETDENAVEMSETQESVSIFVDVGGAVVSPGVVSVPGGSRVFEAVEQAGGITAEADTRFMNMAQTCEDGQKIYVPTADEVNSQNSGGNSAVSYDSSGADWYSAVTGSSGAAESGKVNINTAGSEELQTLTGIGPAMASRIIEYRDTNGQFSQVEDLLDVSGIGEKTLAKFKDDICV